MTEKTVLQVLTEARALIADPERWWDGTLSGARSENHCAVQAVCAVVGKKTDRGLYVDVCDGLASQFGGTHQNLPKFNDTHTHAEVLALFDTAIESERAKSRQAVIDQLLDDAQPGQDSTPLTGPRLHSMRGAA